jgi:hypothetical protein
MTQHDDIDEERAALIDRNIELAFALAHEIVEQPARLDELPSGAMVFVVPPDDPAFAEAQTNRALRAARTGNEAYLWRLDAPAGERAAFRARVITPRWPMEGIDPAAVYYRAIDTLVVDFFHGRREGVPLPGERFGVLFIDEGTEEVVVNILPQFLSRVVRRDYALIDVLLRPETELHGITQAEVRQIRNMLAHSTSEAAAPPAEFLTIVAHMEKLEALTA